MSLPKIWGPPLWTILHTYTERLGNHTIEIMSTDQRRAWINFLKAVEFVIPCARCRAHYKDWRTKHPIDHFARFQGPFLRQKAREWLWGLHDEINRENGLMSPAIESITEVYSSKTEADVQKAVDLCLVEFKKAIPAVVGPAALRTFQTNLTMLRRFL
jgi:hypothetical protein